MNMLCKNVLSINYCNYNSIIQFISAVYSYLSVGRLYTKSNKKYNAKLNQNVS